MKYWTAFIVCFLITSPCLFGQTSLYLVKKANGKIKRFKPSARLVFSVKTDSSERNYYGKVIQITDSTLTIENSSNDNSTIKISKIQAIINLLVNNTESTGMAAGSFIVGGILALAATPIVLIFAPPTALEVLTLSGGLLAAGGIILLPNLIQRKHDLRKWEITRYQMD